MFNKEEELYSDILTPVEQFERIWLSKRISLYREEVECVISGTYIPREIFLGK